MGKVGHPIVHLLLQAAPQEKVCLFYLCSIFVWSVWLFVFLCFWLHHVWHIHFKLSGKTLFRTMFPLLKLTHLLPCWISHASFTRYVRFCTFSKCARTQISHNALCFIPECCISWEIKKNIVGPVFFRHPVYYLLGFCSCNKHPFYT
jgi:hypothetical protein